MDRFLALAVQGPQGRENLPDLLHLGRNTAQGPANREGLVGEAPRLRFRLGIEAPVPDQAGLMFEAGR